MSASSKVLRRVICLVAAIIATTTALAQMGGMPRTPRIESLDMTIARAKSIVTGVLTEVPDFYGAYPTGTLVVQQTLRGEPTRMVKVQIDLPIERLKRWRDSRHKLLVALPGDGGPDTAFDLSDSNIMVLTADLKLLRSGDQVVAAVQKLVAEPRAAENPKQFNLALDRQSFKGTPLLLSFSEKMGLDAIVPLDRRVEHWAQSATRSRDVRVRLRAVDGLRPFKSDENARILKRLLRDRGFIIWFPGPDANDGSEIHRFVVRESAYELLAEWGVRTTKPLLEEVVSILSSTSSISFRKRLTDSDLDVLSRNPNLRQLDISVDLTREQFAKICSLRRLTELSTIRGGVDDRNAHLLTNLVHLDRLYIQNNSLTDEGLKEIGDMPALTFVNLVGTRVTDDGIARLRHQKPGLSIYTGRR